MIVSVLGCVSLVKVERLSDGISLETAKIDELGKGRDLPIPCPRDNICYKDRGHA